MLAMDHILPVKMLIDLAAAAKPVLEVRAFGFAQAPHSFQLPFSYCAHAQHAQLTSFKNIQLSAWRWGK